MTRPRVTIHNTVSIDGKVTGFDVDLGLNCEIAGRILHDAVLTGTTPCLPRPLQSASTSPRRLARQLGRILGRRQPAPTGDRRWPEAPDAPGPASRPAPLARRPRPLHQT